jgi:DNA-binding NtrC family response regulator
MENTAGEDMTGLEIGRNMRAQFHQECAGSIDVEPRPAGDSPHPPEQSAAARVLVVDDESLLRWSLAETLGASGYEVTEAIDGASAIRAMASADVVLLDLHLPDSSDLRVLAAMRQLSPKIPIILMTAFATPEVLNESVRLGAFAVLDKPFDMSDVSPLVGRALAPHPAH